MPHKRHFDPWRGHGSCLGRGAAAMAEAPQKEGLCAVTLSSCPQFWVVLRRAQCCGL